jgi:6,7-dimethyl-8-ribityllumazine synthase
VTTGGKVDWEGELHGEGLRVAVVASRFNGDVTERLLDGAVDGLRSHGVDPTSIRVAWVPGAFELPLAAHRLASSGEVDAVVCVGAVIRGDTDHNVYVAGQCAAGLQRAQLDTGVPVAFGVLTTDSVEDALARAGGRHGNKGAEAASAAVQMADLLRQLPKAAGRA